MKKVFFFVMILFLPFCVSAVEINNEVLYSITGDYIDLFTEIHEIEGGYIVVGHLSSSDIEGYENLGDQDVIILQFDNEWNLIKRKIWGGNKNDGFLETYITSAGELIGVGRTYSTNVDGINNNGNSDAFVIKFDKNLDEIWVTSFGGSNADEFDSLYVDELGNIYVTGKTSSSSINDLENNGSYDGLFVVYDKDGKLLLNKMFGGNKVDDLNFGFKNNSNNHFIVFGTFVSTNIENLQNIGGRDLVILEFDENGEIIFSKSFGTENDDYFDDGIYKDGEYIVAGHSNFKVSNYYNSIPYIIKFNKDFEILSYEYLLGDGSNYFYNITMDSNSNIYVSGKYSSNDIDGLEHKGGGDTIIIKYDKDGDLLFKYGWGGSSYEQYNDFFINDNGEIFLVGGSASDDIDDSLSKGSYYDAFINRLIINYDVNISDKIKNGSVNVEQQGKYRVINLFPNKGYEVDKVIVKDKNDNEIEVTKLNDNTYSFELYSDVSVEVLFKEVLSNPKTGEVNYKLCICVILMLSIFGLSYLYLYRKNSIL